MAQQNKNVCSFNKFGFCKFRSACRRQHVMEICPKNKQCEIEKCSLRHPQTCRYHRDIGYCKFGDYCLFNHDEESNYPKEIQKIAKKLKKLRERLKTTKSACDLSLDLVGKKSNLKVIVSKCLILSITLYLLIV